MNETIKTQLNHKSIRKFKDLPLEEDIINQLIDVARHTSTSNFMQSYSIISVTDPLKKKQIAHVGKQAYIANSGHLFIFLVDQNRNMSIAQELNTNTNVLHSFDRFLIGASDALLAASNVLTAAESLGLGGVFLGSILNDADQIIQILNLPELVFPILGLAIGYPDQTPQLKPRLPKEMIHFENEYPRHQQIVNTLENYDKVVEQYYDLRDENRRIDRFTKQIKDSMDRRPSGRMKLLDYLQKQGFIKF